MSRSKSLSLDAVMNKLRDTAIAINRRGRAKPHEQRRIDEALTLLANRVTLKDMGIRSQSTYLDFLQKVHEGAGLSMVGLRAVGLGKSAIGFLKERIRIDLPYEIQKVFASLDNRFLHDVCEGYPTKCEADCISL